MLKHYFLPVISVAILCVMIGLIFFPFLPTNQIDKETKSQSGGTVVIDAGHGGEDGGAISCTGKLESHINLEIAIRLNDFMRLLGWDTIMTRSTDVSIYTNGKTLTQKKVSDLQERVRIVNGLNDGVLISIHQNNFPNERYHGAQVFYASTDGSKLLANRIQEVFLQTINPGSNRNVKSADGIYLMQNIETPGVLIECGFLSNAEEERLLSNAEYQKQICAIVGTVVSCYMKDRMLS